MVTAHEVNLPGIPGVGPGFLSEAEARASGAGATRQDIDPREQRRADATKGVDMKIQAYRDFMDGLPEPETKEQRLAREGREKSRRVVRAVGDGLRAISNLVFTTRYAPNMYDHERSSALKSYDARLDKLKADRDAERDRYYNFAIRLGDAEAERARTLRELEAEEERRKLAREKAQREANEHPVVMEIKRAQQRRENARATTAEADAKVAPELAGEKVASQRALTRQRQAAAAASYARGQSYGKTVHHFRGKDYESDKDYTKDVAEAARQYNERHMVEVEEVVTDKEGNKTKQKVKRYQEGFVPIVTEDIEETGYGQRRKARNPEEYAGEVERRLAEEEADNRPPSRRNNDNRPPSRQ